MLKLVILHKFRPRGPCAGGSKKHKATLRLGVAYSPVLLRGSFRLVAEPTGLPSQSPRRYWVVPLCSAKAYRQRRHWHWDGVDWLDPSRALVLVTGRMTEDNSSKEMQGKHDANADPVTKNRSGEIADCQPVPQEQENPTLQAVNAEHQTQAEQTDQDKHQATVILIHRN